MNVLNGIIKYIRFVPNPSIFYSLFSRVAQSTIRFFSLLKLSFSFFFFRIQKSILKILKGEIILAETEENSSRFRSCRYYKNRHKFSEKKGYFEKCESYQFQLCYASPLSIEIDENLQLELIEIQRDSASKHKYTWMLGFHISIIIYRRCVTSN